MDEVQSKAVESIASAMGGVYDEALRITALAASNLRKDTGAERVRCTVTVEGLDIQISIGDWTSDEDDDD